MSSEENKTLGTMAKYERNKKIQEGHALVTRKLEQEAVVKLKHGESKLSSEVLAKLDSISVTLKKKQEYLVALDNEILEKCSIDKINKEIEEATETSANIEETLSKSKALKMVLIFQIEQF